MHVCHFSDTALESEYFRNIAHGLAKRGVRVSLVDLGPGSPPKWLSEVENVSYLSLEAGGKLSYPFAIGRLARYLKDESVDILQTHLFHSGIIGVLAKRRVPATIVVLTRHHSSVVRMLGSRLHIAADKWMAEKADHVITVSEAARDYMHDVDGIKRDIDVVYLGFDFEKIYPDKNQRRSVRHEFAFDADDLVIGYVGSFVPGKGQQQLIRAFAEITREIPRARLFLVGRGMPKEIAIEVAKFPESKIVFAGWRDDVPACLNAMDLFVQPSLSEAFSQVLIEAMGVGLPVIATRVGGAQEVIDDGLNGILIEPDSPAEIAGAAVKLLRDEELRKKLGSEGMSNVRGRFTAAEMVNQLMVLYERWLDHL